jgi:hypothetical protein
VTLAAILREVEARLAWIRDEFDPVVREQALADLEDDVASWLAAYEERRAA